MRKSAASIFFPQSKYVVIYIIYLEGITPPHSSGANWILCNIISWAYFVYMWLALKVCIRNVKKSIRHFRRISGVNFHMGIIYFLSMQEQQHSNYKITKLSILPLIENQRIFLWGKLLFQKNLNKVKTYLNFHE